MAYNVTLKKTVEMDGKATKVYRSTVRADIVRFTSNYILVFCEDATQIQDEILESLTVDRLDGRVVFDPSEVNISVQMIEYTEKPVEEDPTLQ